MTKVARSSTHNQNINKLVVHRHTFHLQTHPGNFAHNDDLPSTSALEYTLRHDGQFSQSGVFKSNQSAQVLIKGGSKAVLDALGSQYEIVPLLQLSPSNTLLGAQQRLRLLGYLDREPSEIWDAAIDRAILNFQADNGFDAKGILCDDTLNGIQNAFGE